MEALLLRSCWVQARARSKAVSSVLKRLLAFNSVCLPNRAGKIEAPMLRSCWVQARARSKAVSSDLKRLFVLNRILFTCRRKRRKVLKRQWRGIKFLPETMNYALKIFILLFYYI
jgi:hypothetical protein